VRRSAAIFALSLCAVAVLPAGAAAHSLVRPGGAVVSYISADATSLNTLVVRPSGSRIEFRDPTVDGGMDPGSCTPGELGPNSWIIQTFCPASGVQRVRLDLGEREDTATVTIGIAASMLGGPGADTLGGGPAGDELRGDEGNDDLNGGEGDDAVDGGAGTDKLDGGPGGDSLLSRDGLSESVSCGDGTDSVDADTVDDVALDCESVSRTFTPPPAGGGADDGKPPALEVGAPAIQRLGRSRKVHVYATSSEVGHISASGFLDIAGLQLPVIVGRKRVSVGGGGVTLTYRLAPRRWRAARRALHRGRRVALRLGVVATDQAGRTTQRRAPRVRLVAGAAAHRLLARAAHPEPNDVDGDEVPNAIDNCPFTKNGSQTNTDGDAEGDACDADDDNDGVLDAADNCRVVSNPGQEDTDQDGRGDACPPVDTDGDGTLDENDNCRLADNSDQADLDQDGKGDICDSDADGDHVSDGGDNCPGVFNPAETRDVNGDGVVTWRDQLDQDGDGIGTLCDAEEASIDPGPGGGSDKTPPALKLQIGRAHRLAVVRAGLVTRLRCPEACRATVELVLSRRLARRLGLRNSQVIAGGSAQLQGAGTTYAFVRFTKRALRALSGRKRITARLQAIAVDDAGNVKRVSRRLVLRA
jgi:Thrombospondin type 3 repeat